MPSDSDEARRRELANEAIGPEGKHWGPGYEIIPHTRWNPESTAGSPTECTSYCHRCELVERVETALDSYAREVAARELRALSEAELPDRAGWARAFVAGVEHAQRRMKARAEQLEKGAK